MTSARLRRWLDGLLLALAAGGRRELVREFVGLDHGAEFRRLPAYVESLRGMQRKAAEQGAAELARLLRYLVARTLAYPLDRPKEALPIAAELVAETAAGGRRAAVLGPLCELELLRAFHKIDAPGHREALIAGVHALWPRLRDDLGPCTELLDVHWRTGWFCRDPELMRAASRLAHSEARVLRFSAAYWHGRALALEGAHAEAAALLAELLESRDELREAGEPWGHYVAAELAANEAACGRVEQARARLERIVRETQGMHDPMLSWDVARALACAADAVGDARGACAAWASALDAVDGLGTDRLECEFAVALGRSARACEDDGAFERARRVLGAALPALKSREDLEREARAIAGLYS